MAQQKAAGVLVVAVSVIGAIILLKKSVAAAVEKATLDIHIYDESGNPAPERIKVPGYPSKEFTLYFGVSYSIEIAVTNRGIPATISLDVDSWMNDISGNPLTPPIPPGSFNYEFASGEVYTWSWLYTTPTLGGGAVGQLSTNISIPGGTFVEIITHDIVVLGALY